MMKISIVNKDNKVIASSEDIIGFNKTNGSNNSISPNNSISSNKEENKVSLKFNGVYDEGEKIVFTAEAGEFVTIDLDPYITQSIVYLKDGNLDFLLPFGDWKEAYHPNAFYGNDHTISMEKTDENILKTRRNLALNGLDKRGEQNYFPHSDPNIVTRDEPWFEGRNAIDGYKDTKGHGPFPFQSWGGGLRDDLEFVLYFGREVIIDEIILYLRADYDGDHDINWESGVFEFSDGSSLIIKMIKTTEGQSFSFEPKKVTWIKLNHLRREISAAFSALTQIEVMGIES